MFNNINVRFTDFIVHSAFCKLQNEFIQYSNIKLPKINEVILEDLIIRVDGDPTFYEPPIPVEYEFYNDFLIPKIRTLHDDYLNLFLKSLNKVNSEEDSKTLGKRYVEKIISFIGFIKTANYLRPDIQIVLLEELDAFELSISDYIQNPYSKIKDKLVFKWSRTDVTYFFHHLRISKQIEYISDGHLGRIIDSVFECQSPESKEVVPINSARKQLNNYTNNDRGIKQPYNRLKAIFMAIFNKDFH